METNQIVTSAIIKNSENKILIVKRADDDSFPGMWEFPGGKAEFGEHPENGVKREILEECGLTIMPQFPVVVNSYKSSSKINTYNIEIFFLCAMEPGKQEVTLSPEHSDFAWISPKEINNFETTEYIHDVIEKARDHLLH